LISPEEWQPLADALAAAAVSTGLKLDTECTIDRTRVLRIAGTKNYKNKDNPTAVEIYYDEGGVFIFEELQQALTPYLQQLATGNAMPSFLEKMKTDTAIRQSGFATDDDHDDFGGSGEHKALPRDIEQVALACPHVANALKTGGAGYAETLWRDDLRIAHWCKNREQTAHRLSQGHDGYDPIKTEEKLKEVEKYQLENDLGFPRCKTIQKNGAKECAGCAWLKFDKSPLSAKAIIPDAINPETGQYQPVRGGHYSA
jgi:hypothetical protein